MSFKITGTVKFNQFSHEYALDLNVTEAQPEQNVNQLATEPEAPITYTVEFRNTSNGEWTRSCNNSLGDVFIDYDAAERALHAERSTLLDYRILTSGGIAVYFDAVPEVPSTFIVELGTRGEWSQSVRHGLCGVNFATRELAEEAKERFGNYGVDYRVTEVPATVDAVPEVEPSTFVVDAFINAEWVRSGNAGLGGIRFATRAKALEAIIEYGNIDSVKYRVTEVIQ
jgi:hypothetical protein